MLELEQSVGKGIIKKGEPFKSRFGNYVLETAIKTENSGFPTNRIEINVIRHRLRSCSELMVFACSETIHLDYLLCCDVCTRIAYTARPVRGSFIFREAGQT